MQAETTRTKYKADYSVESKTEPMILPENICGDKDHFNRNDLSKVLSNHDERNLFFNEMWAYKPHQKKEGKNSNSNIPHGM